MRAKQTKFKPTMSTVSAKITLVHCK